MRVGADNFSVKIKLITILKKLFRPVYYYFYQDRITIIENIEILKGKKWKIDKRNDRAYFKGYYEPKITKLIIDNLKPDSTFIDVGAHAGFFSLLASAIINKGKIISFDPDKENFNFMAEIMRLNQIDNWEIHNLAVGDKYEKLKFKEGITSSTGSIDESGEVEIKAISLDTFFSTRDQMNNCLIKIDVEGYGGKVLIGAMDLINELRPIIIFEIHDPTEERDILSQSLGSKYCFYDCVSGISIDINDLSFRLIYCVPK